MRKRLFDEFDQLVHEAVVFTNNAETSCNRHYYYLLENSRHYRETDRVPTCLACIGVRRRR